MAALRTAWITAAAVVIRCSSRVAAGRLTSAAAIDPVPVAAVSSDLAAGIGPAQEQEIGLARVAAHNGPAEGSGPAQVRVPAPGPRAAAMPSGISDPAEPRARKLRVDTQASAAADAVVAAARGWVAAVAAHARAAVVGPGGGCGRGGGGGGRRSDIALKHDIVLLGHLPSGLGYYRFSYNGSDKAYVGVMAQDVQTIAPNAVTRGPDGYLRVFYDRLGVKFQTYQQWIASGARVPAAVPVSH